MTKSRIFLYSCLAFISGVALASFFSFSQLVLLGLLILGIFLISVFWRNKTMVVLGFCVLFLVLGAWRHQLAKAQFERPELESLAGQKVDLMGIVEEEPELRGQQLRLKLKIEQGLGLLITTRPYPKIEYGDKLKIQGILKKPRELEGFNYQNYLQKEGIHFLMSYPKIEILAKSQGNFLKAQLISFKKSLRAGLGQTVSSPQSGLFEALLFGEESNISPEWKERLNKTGTRHIAAVSGMNITIISQVLLAFLLALGLWRQQAFWLSLILIFLYVLMIGAPASGVRAAIMGALVLLSQQVGRIVDPFRLLVFALALMLVHNPLLLTQDVGFQLSFLAVAGLIYLQPFFVRWLRKLPNFFQVRTSLSSTLAAQVFTFPLLLYNFGQFSLIAPLTNVLILPSLLYLTMGAFLFSLLAIFSSFLGQVLSWPFQLLLRLIMQIIEFFSQFSWASANLQVDWLFILISYSFLSFLVWRLKEREKLRFLRY